MGYRVNGKVFETENEAREFSRDLMSYGGLGGWMETTDTVTHIYKGDGYTEPVTERRVEDD